MEGGDRIITWCREVSRTVCWLVLVSLERPGTGDGSWGGPRVLGRVLVRMLTSPPWVVGVLVSNDGVLVAMDCTLRWPPLAGRGRTTRDVREGHGPIEQDRLSDGEGRSESECARRNFPRS